MAEICDLDRNFVSGLLPKSVLKMESMTDEKGCVCVIESVNGSFYAEDHPKITVTLRSSTSEISCSEINNKRPISPSQYRPNAVLEPVVAHRNKSILAQTTVHSFSLGIVHEHVRVETGCDSNGTNVRLQNHSFSSPATNNLNDTFASKDKNAQSIVKECDILNASLPIQKCDNLHKIMTSSPTYSADSVETVGPVCENGDQYETEYQLSPNEFQNDLHICYESAEEDSSFASEIRMICENEDFFPESTEDAITSENKYFSDHAYHNTTPGSVEQCSSSNYFNCNLKSEHIPIYNNIQEDFPDEQYENIELSSIFSSSDIYQRSFDQSYSANSISSSQANDSSTNFITDLNSRPGERLMADSGVFGLSLPDSGSEYFQCDGMQYPHMVSSAQSEITGSRTGLNKDCDLFKPQGPFPTPVANSEHANTALYSAQMTNSAHANAAFFSDPSTQLMSNVHTGPLEHHCGLHYKSTATSTYNSTGLSFCCNAFEKSPSVPPFYDSCVSDYRRYIHQTPYSHSATSTEWKSWFKGSNTAYDNPASLITSNQSADDVCPVTSTDIECSVTKPDIVQFIEIQAKEDEETDDADETDYLPVCFNTTSEHSASYIDPQTVGTTEYLSENTAGYSPSVLTPPPSASSTPVPSNTQESTCDEVDMSALLSTPHYTTSQIYSSTTGPALVGKLKQEQLETSLLSFGLSQGAKRPYPSMADAMRSSRSKSSTRKKCSQESPDQLPRRSGRPRKTQIQSDAISTTAMNNKQKKRTVSKQKSEPPAQDVRNLKSSEDRVVAGTSRTPGISRHNEPLNQHAIGIMTQWFEDHIDNPYPNKTDKEKMAVQGGITENQVKSWFANKRNRTNNTKPKVQKRAMEEKLKEIFRDLKRNRHNPMADNSHVIQQLSGIIQHCHADKVP